MIDWDAAQVAAAAGARLIAPAPVSAGGRPGPSGVAIDSRAVRPGDLFVGLTGRNVDGGAYAAAALAAGAWGVLVAPEHAEDAQCAKPGALLAHPQPLAGLQALARAWRRALGARVIAVTGSTGKTSTKEILHALLSPQRRTASSPENLNTEIGLPLAILGAPPDTEVLVLEMAMRGPGQIAELAQIAEPDVGVIVSVGPVHLQLLGSLEAIAAAKAELIDALAPGATAVLPAGEPLLEGHVRSDVRTVTFGDGGDVRLVQRLADGEVVVADGERLIRLWPAFTAAHQLRNLLAAVAAARALGVTPQGAVEPQFARGRGERLGLPGGAVLLNDCYNANPMSMRAALDELAETAPGRRVAVLGDMLELGPDELRFHREIGEYAADRGVELLVTVGPLAATMAQEFTGESHVAGDVQQAAAILPGLLRSGDTVLVKGSYGVGLLGLASVLGAAPLEPAGDGAVRGGTR